MRRPLVAALAAVLLGGVAGGSADGLGGGVAVAQESGATQSDGLPGTAGGGLEGARPAQSLAARDTALDEVNEALLPYGELTPYEPLKKSLDDLLDDGWRLDQASGDLDGFTLLLSQGSARALCFLVPRDLGQADSAIVDCRRLN